MKKILVILIALVVGLLGWKVYHYVNASIVTDQRAVAVDLVKQYRGDLSDRLTNSEALDEILRREQPSSIYGWGGYELDGNRYTVDFIYRGKETVMFVWIVNPTDRSVKNVTNDQAFVASLKTSDKLNLPYDKELMPYDIEYTMASFRNSDYYHGRGYGPKEEHSRYSNQQSAKLSQKDLDAVARKSTTWASPDSAQYVVTYRVDGPASEQKIRDQSAGLLDSIAQNNLLLFPTKCRIINIKGLPGIRIDGIAHGGTEKRCASLIAVFSTDRSYLIHCTSPLGSTIEELDTKTEAEGEAFKPAVTILEEIVPKIESGIPELQKLMEEVIKKTNHS